MLLLLRCTVAGWRRDRAAAAQGTELRRGRARHGARCSLTAASALQPPSQATVAAAVLPVAALAATGSSYLALISFKSSEVGTLKSMVFSVLVYNLVELY